MRKTPYYLEIYNYLLKQMYDGEIEVGDKLPSIEQLCERFAASPNTVRTVLRRLSDEGYIRTGRGRATQVVSLVGSQVFAIKRLCEQTPNIQAAFELSELLLPSLIQYSVSRLDAQDYAELFRILNEMEEINQEGKFFRNQRSRLMHKLLCKADNALMLNVTNSVEEVILLPRMLFETIPEVTGQLVESRTVYSTRMRQVLILAQEKRFEEMKASVRELYRWNKRIMLELISQLANGEVDLNTPPTIDYLYDGIISEVIDGIYAGDYVLGGFLPAEGRMCERYGVSLPTVKKAYRVLSEMGVTQTLNGKGTQLLLFSGPNIDSPGFQQQLFTHLTAFLETIQFIAETMEDVTVFAAERISRERVQQIDEKLRSLWKERRDRPINSIPVLLFEVVRAVDNPGLSSLYRQMKRRLIWSIYLDRFCPDMETERERRHYLCLEALMELRHGRPELFGQKLRQVLLRCHAQYRVCFTDQLHKLSAAGGSFGAGIR